VLLLEVEVDVVAALMHVGVVDGAKAAMPGMRDIDAMIENFMAEQILF